MRVAYIGQKGFPASYGGVERHVQELATRLAERGHHPFVYNRPSYNPRPPSEYEGVEVVTLPSVGTKHLDAISHVTVCTAHAISHGAEVIHYHAIGPALLSWMPRLARARSVVTVHGRDWQRPKWGRAASSVLRAGEWMAMHAPDKTIVVSRSLAAELSRDYGRPVTYIPNGLTLEKDEDTSFLAELGLRPGGYILFASRLVPEKGAHYLVRACRSLASDLTLVVAGDSSFSDDYADELRAACVGQPVIFPGYVYGPRLATLFRHAALFVLPSDVEGLPIVLLEALGYGTPVLASDIPPNREVLAGFGRLFKAGDVEDLIRQLEGAIADLPALREEAAGVAPTILSAYDWDSVAEATIAVYQAALEHQECADGCDCRH